MTTILPTNSLSLCPSGIYMQAWDRKTANNIKEILNRYNCKDGLPVYISVNNKLYCTVNNVKVNDLLLTELQEIQGMRINR